MKAYLLKKHGKPEVLKICDAEEPKPKKNEVKIKVEYIGLNYAEILSRRGQYNWAPKKPYVLGMEGMGEITEINSEGSTHKIGDKVIFGNQTGAYAEYITVPDHMASPVLPEFTDEENAAFLVNFMTAWISLFNMGRMKPQDIVLIQAAAGGVGTAAVQLAHHYGCRVYGTASKPEKLELIEKLGADKAINYTTEDFLGIIKQKDGGVDLVLEVVGGEVFKKSVELLNPFGRLVVTGYASIPLKKWNPLTWWPTWRDAPKAPIMKMAQNSYGILASHIGYLIERPDIVKKNWEELTQYVKKYGIKPVISKVFNFEDLPEAHHYIESRESYGKVLIKV